MVVGFTIRRPERVKILDSSLRHRVTLDIQDSENEMATIGFDGLGGLEAFRDRLTQLLEQEKANANRPKPAG